MLLTVFQSQMQVLKQVKLCKYSLAGFKTHFSTSNASSNLIIDKIAKVTEQKPEKRWHYLQSIDLDLYNNFSSLTPAQSFQILQSFANHSNYHLLRSYSIQNLLSIILRNAKGDFDVQSIVLDLALILKLLKYQYIEDYDLINKLLLSKNFEEFSIEELQKLVDFWEYYSWRHPINSEMARFLDKVAESHSSYLSEKKDLTSIDMATEIKVLILKALMNPKRASEVDIATKYQESLAKYISTNSKVASTLEIFLWIPDLELVELKNFQQFVEKLYRMAQESFVRLINQKDIYSNRIEKRDLEVLADELFSKRKIESIFAALASDKNELSVEGLILVLSKLKKYDLLTPLHSYAGLVEKFQNSRVQLEKSESKTTTIEENRRLSILFDDLDIYVS